MAIQYDPKRDAGLIIDPTSKAARVTLYDANGALVNQTSGYPPDAQTYSYMSGIVASSGLTASQIQFIFINRAGHRRVLLRSIRVHQNNFNTATAAQAQIKIDKVRLAAPYATTSAAAVLVVGAYNEPVAKSTGAPPSVVDIISEVTSATAFLVPTTIVATITNAVIPVSTNKSQGEFQVVFADDGPDADFTLEYCEALVFTTSATVVSNSATVNFEWDEVEIPAQRSIA